MHKLHRKMVNIGRKKSYDNINGRVVFARRLRDLKLLEITAGLVNAPLCFSVAAKENKVKEIARTGAEQLIRAANFPRYRGTTKTNCRNFREIVELERPIILQTSPLAKSPCTCATALLFRAFPIGVTSSPGKSASSTTPCCAHRLAIFHMPSGRVPTMHRLTPVENRLTRAKMMFVFALESQPFKVRTVETLFRNNGTC